MEGELKAIAKSWEEAAKAPPSKHGLPPWIALAVVELSKRDVERIQAAGDAALNPRHKSELRGRGRDAASGDLSRSGRPISFVNIFGIVPLFR